MGRCRRSGGAALRISRLSAELGRQGRAERETRPACCQLPDNSHAQPTRPAPYITTVIHESARSSIACDAR